MTAAQQNAGPSWFQRFLLPGFAFKAVVIGGGYATGRELAEFFLPAGAWHGLAAMLVAAILWSCVCALTFRLAVMAEAYDYRAFFRTLLGRAWVLFEIVYLLFVILILAVFGAAAGAIGKALFDAPMLVGSAALALAIGLFATFGNRAVEQLFKWVSILLYLTYAIFLLLTLTHFGGRIQAGFALAPLQPSWLAGGIAYASYNVVGAVVILPVLRHLTSRRDAVVAGLIAGPLAMAPACIFFIAMIAFYPGIAAATLPSDLILTSLRVPAFHVAFQLMIFCALLESGTGSVHAVNERIAAVWRTRRGVDLPLRLRAACSAAILIGCVFMADRFGLVALIGAGYRLLAVAILAVYVAPLLIVTALRRLRPLRAPPTLSTT